MVPGPGTLFHDMKDLPAELPFSAWCVITPSSVSSYPYGLSGSHVSEHNWIVSETSYMRLDLKAHRDIILVQSSYEVPQIIKHRLESSSLWVGYPAGCNILSAGLGSGHKT